MSQTCLEFCLDAIGMLLGGTSARANDGVGMTYVQALTHNGNGRWSPRIEAMLCFVDTSKRAVTALWLSLDHMLGSHASGWSQQVDSCATTSYNGHALDCHTLFTFHLPPTPVNEHPILSDYYFAVYRSF